MTEQAEAIEHFLQSGEYDPTFAAWRGDVLSRPQEGSAALRRALIEAIERNAPAPSITWPVPSDLRAFTRSKVEPMVRGLFSRSEHDRVLGMLERSVVFLVPANIRSVIESLRWHHSAWVLASMYLDAVGGKAISDAAPQILGLSEETTCFVSPAYFREQSPFADYIVHEAAHVFHNCKRGTIGLKETRRREWLLDIDYRKRETFAYCCEAHSRILALAKGPAERRQAVEQLASGLTIPGDERVDPLEYVDILREASSARNGWKQILAHCRP